MYLNGFVNELLDVHLHTSAANGASVSVQMVVSHLKEISVLGALDYNLGSCVHILRTAIIVLVPMHKPCLLNEFLGSQPVGVHTAALVATLSVKVVVRTLEKDVTAVLASDFNECLCVLVVHLGIVVLVPMHKPCPLDEILGIGFGLSVAVRAALSAEVVVRVLVERPTALVALQLNLG